MIQRIEDFDEYLQLVKTTPCVVKFTASWCGPCKRIAPLYKDLSQKYADNVKFLEIDIDAATEITNHENIKGIPILLFYGNGTKREDLTTVGASGLSISNNVETFVTELTSTYKIVEPPVKTNSTDSSLNTLTLNTLALDEQDDSDISTDESEGLGGLEDSESSPKDEYGKDFDFNYHAERPTI